MMKLQLLEKWQFSNGGSGTTTLAPGEGIPAHTTLVLESI